jgi:hypothetical protein
MFAELSSTAGLEIMLVGIDGDGDGDMEMVRIAEEVGIMFLSVVTVFERGWGTRIRNQSETQKGRRAGMENLWTTTAVVVWMGFVAAAIVRLIASRFVPGLVLEMMLASSAAIVG